MSTSCSFFHLLSIFPIALIEPNKKKQQNRTNRTSLQHLPLFTHCHRSRNHQTLTVGSSESELDSSAQSESTSSFAAWRCWKFLKMETSHCNIICNSYPPGNDHISPSKVAGKIWKMILPFHRRVIHHAI